nr:MAG TPA: hypothetical protein [Caudoviricetes sp.]
MPSSLLINSFAKFSIKNTLLLGSQRESTVL